VTSKFFLAPIGGLREIDIFFFSCFGMFHCVYVMSMCIYIMYSIGEDTKEICILHDHGQGSVETGGGVE